jgi:hypothetical protein
MSDPNTSESKSVEPHAPCFELRFHVPRFPNLKREAYQSLMPECMGIVLAKLAPYLVNRIEVYGDGIKAVVYVPKDPCIKLSFFDAVRDEIQHAIIMRAEARATGKLDAQGELKRLALFVVDHIDTGYTDGAHRSLGTNHEIVESVMSLLLQRSDARRILYSVREEGRKPRVLVAAYPSAAATNYVAVCEPEPMHVKRYVKVRAWPFGLVHHTVEVENAGTMQSATVIERT